MTGIASLFYPTFTYIIGRNKSTITTTFLAGKYMYIETSSPRKSGDKARFVSERFPGIPASSNYCLRFWYHMYGSSIGTLNVLIKNKAGNISTAEKIVWSLSGNMGQGWKSASVPIQSTTGFQVKIRELSLCLFALTTGTTFRNI